MHEASIPKPIVHDSEQQWQQRGMYPNVTKIIHAQPTGMKSKIVPLHLTHLLTQSDCIIIYKPGMHVHMCSLDGWKA